MYTYERLEGRDIAASVRRRGYPRKQIKPETSLLDQRPADFGSLTREVMEFLGNCIWDDSCPNLVRNNGQELGREPRRLVDSAQVDSSRALVGEADVIC